MLMNLQWSGITMKMGPCILMKASRTAKHTLVRKPHSTAWRNGTTWITNVHMNASSNFWCQVRKSKSHVMTLDKWSNLYLQTPAFQMMTTRFWQWSPCFTAAQKWTSAHAGFEHWFHLHWHPPCPDWGWWKKAIVAHTNACWWCCR